MRRPVSSLLVAAAVAGAGLLGPAAAHASTDAGPARVSAPAVTEHVLGADVFEASVPDTTVVPAGETDETGEEDEDRAAGYVVMLVAVLVFIGGFAIIAVRSRKR